MVRDRKPEWQSQTVQERLVGEVSDFLKVLTKNAQQGTQLGRTKKRRARQPLRYEFNAQMKVG